MSHLSLTGWTTQQALPNFQEILHDERRTSLPSKSASGETPCAGDPNPYSGSDFAISATKAYLKFVKPNPCQGKQEPGVRLESDKALWPFRHEIYRFHAQVAIDEGYVLIL
jgi:hypothetical protein